MIIKRENAVKGFFLFFFQRSQVFPTAAAFGSWGSVCGQRCVPVLLYTAVAAAADELADVEKR